MGYIELKTGQVALRSKKIILPEFTMPARSDWMSVTYGNGKICCSCRERFCGGILHRWHKLDRNAST